MHPRRRGVSVGLGPAEEGEAEEARFTGGEGWGRGLVGGPREVGVGMGVRLGMGVGCLGGFGEVGL